MSMNKSFLLLIVAITMSQLCAASASSLQSLMEQETESSGISVCLNAEAHPESLEYKVKCLSSLMNEFYHSLNAGQFKKAYSFVRIMNKFEPLHPDLKSSSEIEASIEQADGHTGMFSNGGKNKRRTFFVGK